MNVVQTLLVFVGIPLAVVLAFAAAIYGRSQIHQPNRYRPGRPWSYPSVWYVPHPEAISATRASELPAIEGAAPAPLRPAGGASGEW
jgi:hypothetical protein